jgi:hypothetical protein
MGSQWQAVVVDAADPARLARWWAEVLGLRVLREAAAEVTVGAGDGSLPVLHFARSNGTATAPGRVQLDLQPDDPQGEVERLVNMGARPVDSGHEGGVLLADPEGNAFRVLHRAAGGRSA